MWFVSWSLTGASNPATVSGKALTAVGSSKLLLLHKKQIGILDTIDALEATCEDSNPSFNIRVALLGNYYCPTSQLGYLRYLSGKDPPEEGNS